MLARGFVISLSAALMMAVVADVHAQSAASGRSGACSDCATVLALSDQQWGCLRIMLQPVVASKREAIRDFDVNQCQRKPKAMGPLPPGGVPLLPEPLIITLSRPQQLCVDSLIRTSTPSAPVNLASSCRSRTRGRRRG